MKTFGVIAGCLALAGAVAAATVIYVRKDRAHVPQVVGAQPPPPRPLPIQNIVPPPPPPSYPVPSGSTTAQDIRSWEDAITGGVNLANTVYSDIGDAATILGDLFN